MEPHLVAEISTGALRSNLALLREQTGPGVELFPVVKADAYGHGLAVVLPILAPLVDGIAVATYQEALEARDLGYAGPVLVFYTPATLGTGPERDEAIRDLVDKATVFTVSTRDDLRLLGSVGAGMGRRPRVELKIDTGMNRSGAPRDKSAGLLRDLREHEQLELTGVYTQFANAADAEDGFVEQQLDRFLAVVEDGGGRAGLTLHAANSAATLRRPETHLDRVRPGLAIYGYDPTGGAAEAAEAAQGLRPCLRLVSRLSQIKEARAGEGTGYGLSHIFSHPGRFGLVPVGYADGYRRGFAGAAVRVAGRDAPVLGVVSMDWIVVDLSAVKGAEVGDPVEIISAARDDPHSVEALARRAGTVAYEICVGLGKRARRCAVE